MNYNYQLPFTGEELVEKLKKIDSLENILNNIIEALNSLGLWDNNSSKTNKTIVLNNALTLGDYTLNQYNEDGTETMIDFSTKEEE